LSRRRDAEFFQLCVGVRYSTADFDQRSYRLREHFTKVGDGPKCLKTMREGLYVDNGKLDAVKYNLRNLPYANRSKMLCQTEASKALCRIEIPPCLTICLGEGFVKRFRVF
jgi:hypothetical protein